MKHMKLCVDMRFEMWLDDSGEWRWRLLDHDDMTVAVSGESYKRKADCKRSITLVKSAEDDTPVKET